MKYNLSVDLGTTASASVMYAHDSYVRLIGLQVAHTGTGSSQKGIFFEPDSYGQPGVEVDSCIVKHVGALGDYQGAAGIYTLYSGNLKIFNTLIYDFKNIDNTYGIDMANVVDNAYLYNVSIINCTNGIRSNNGHTSAKNVLVQGYAPTGRGAFYGTFNASSDYNATDDDTATGGAHDKVSQTFNFVDALNKDFHLSPFDTVAKDAGTNLSADANLPFSTDIDNQVRPIGANWDIGADEAEPKQVFYSVGQSASDFKTGTPTVTITAGSAVFSVAQTGNIGVGDRVTYNTNQIAYISAKTNSDGAHWSLVTATGGLPADISNSTVVSITREFTSLSSAITLSYNPSHINNASGDLVATNVVLNLPCYYDSGADPYPVTVDGYTTGANNYIKIYTPNNTSIEANSSQRHQGKWDDGKFRVVSNLQYVLFGIADSYVRVIGIQLQNIRTDWADTLAVGNGAAAASSYVLIDSVITRNGIGFGIRGGSGTMGIINCISYGNTEEGISIAFSNSNPNAFVYNNTVYNNGGVGIAADRWGAVNVSNNYSGNNAGGDYYFESGGTFTYQNNISQDASSPNSGSTDCGGHSCRNQSAKFVDAANKDLHLDPTDTVAKNAGANLYADANLPITTDIDGQARPNSATLFDIGADEAATAIYYSVGQNTTDHKTGSPTVTIASGTATFSVPQTTTNMGVGDKVTYNTNSVAYISGKISQTQWQLITATGAMPGNISSSTVVSIEHAFASLNTAVGDVNPGASGASFLNTRDLFAENYQLNIPCYYDSGPDTAAANIWDWSTALSNYIKIYTPNDIETQANTSQRHQGKWDENKYRLDVSATTGYTRVINPVSVDIVVEGLQIGVTNNGYADAVGIQYENAWPSGDSKVVTTYFTENIIRGNSTEVGGEYPSGIKIQYHGGLANTGSTHYIANNIIYGFKVTNGGSGIRKNGERDVVYAYNNTVYDTYNGFVDGSTSGKFVAKNNIAQNCTDGFSGTFDSTSNYNISNLAADAPGVNSKNSTTVTFADATNKNFHLSLTDTAAKNSGVNLQQDPFFHFSQDIDGQERAGTWDIGADEFSEVVLQSEQSSPALDAGLVGHWTFDAPDINGTTAIDTSGNSNNGTITGATPAIGMLGQGIGFDGVSNKITVANSTSLSSATGIGQPRSWGGWIFYKGGSNKFIMGKDWAFHGWHYFIESHSTGNKIGGGVSAGGYPLTGALPLNAWYHIFFTYDGANTRLYQDGILVAGPVAQAAVIADTNPLYFGADVTGEFATDTKLDDMRVYNRALSDSEVGQLYRKGQDTVAAPEASKGNTNGLVGYWSFDGPTISGTTVSDLSGSGNNGTISGATPALGKIGQGMGFDGINNLISVADNNNLSFGNGSADSQMSISAWINMNDASEFKILSKGFAFSNIEYYFRTGNQGSNTDNLMFRVYDNSASVAIGRRYSTALTSYEGRWIHVIATYDGSAAASGIRLYLNGIRVDDSDDNYSTGYVAMENLGSALTIGRYSTYYADGKIDEVRIYNRALSVNEVLGLYDLGKVEIRK